MTKMVAAQRRWRRSATRRSCSLSRLARPDAAEVWVKLEAANPTGSYKDRMALAMIEGAERRRATAAGPDASSSTPAARTGSLAGVRLRGQGLPAAHRRVRRVRGREAPRRCAAFGAELEVLAEPRRHHARPDPGDARARRGDRRPRRRLPRPTSSSNHDMLDGYRAHGRRRSLAQLDGRVDACVAYVGTAGCFLGIARALRARSPDAAPRRGRASASPPCSRAGRRARTASRAAASGFVPPTARRRTRLRRGARRAARPRRSRWPGGRPREEGVCVRAVDRREPRRGARRSRAALGPGRRVVTVQVDSRPEVPRQARSTAR